MKQETIEEAFEKWSEETSKGYDKLDVLRFGTKWQQERSYSEEDMKEAFQVGFNVGYNDETSPSYLTFYEWFNKYKNGKK